MHRANELLGKNVVNEGTGEKIGQVRELVFDAEIRKLVALLETSSAVFGGTRVVRREHVVSLGDVVVVVFDGEPPKLRDDAEVSALRERERQITGTEFVTEGGEKVGEVAEVLLDDRGMVLGYEVKHGLVRDLVGGRDQVPVEDVVSLGRDAVIVRDRPRIGPESAERRWEVWGPAPFSPGYQACAAGPGVLKSLHAGGHPPS